MAVTNNQSLDQLLEVQDCDLTIDALNHKRASLPEIVELKTLNSAMKVLQEQVSEIFDRRHDLDRDQGRLEDEVALIVDRIKEAEAKLYGGEVTGAKDLQVLQAEIRGLQDRQLAMEDDILAVMEAAEPVVAELQAGEADIKSLLSNIDDLNKKVAAAQDDIDTDRNEIEDLRSAIVPGIPTDLMKHYDRLRSQPGRIGIAKLLQGRCLGCHIELSAVEVDRIKKLPADELVSCDECGCILVR